MLTKMMESLTQIEKEASEIIERRKQECKYKILHAKKDAEARFIMSIQEHKNIWQQRVKENIKLLNNETQILEQQSKKECQAIMENCSTRCEKAVIFLLDKFYNFGVQ